MIILRVHGLRPGSMTVGKTTEIAEKEIEHR